MNDNRKKIFIVDDDVVNLTAGKNALSGHYDVFPLDSGNDLLEMLQNVLPDLILLDIMMPEMDGHEALKRLKANKQAAHIPVIFLTSKGDIGTVLEGISGGINDYIVKPFDPAQLLKRVDAQFSKNY
ncbi:MAG: response regulator [Defluviitaleaceae bacterium]|nr:response regulator [Defluviitaleaceae bacterium]